MKGLTAIPSAEERFELMNKFLFTPTIDPSDWVRGAEWSRFEPRLGTLWIERFLKDAPIGPWAEVRALLNSSPWSATVGVLTDWVRLVTTEQATLKAISILTVDLPHAPGEQYFIGLRPIASKGMLDDVRFSLLPYSRWGYFAREWLLPKSISKVESTLLDVTQRLEAQKELATTRERITAEDYRNFVGDTALHRRTAERDLAQSPFWKARGKTRGRFYVRRQGRKPRA